MAIWLSKLSFLGSISRMCLLVLSVHGWGFILALFKWVVLWTSLPAFLSCVVLCRSSLQRLPTITVPTLQIFAWLIFPDVCISNHEYKQLFISNKWGGTLRGKIIHFYEVAAVEIYNFCRKFHFFSGAKWKFNTYETTFRFNKIKWRQE